MMGLFLIHTAQVLSCVSAASVYEDVTSNMQGTASDSWGKNRNSLAKRPEVAISGNGMAVALTLLLCSV